MRARKFIPLLTLAGILPVSLLHAQITMTAYTSFGGGDGWLAPGEGGYTFLGTANNERGLAYGDGELFLESRTGGTSIRILNATTGADMGSLNMTGVSGGTFAVNNLGVGGDGTIYAANLVTASAATGASAFKVYAWATPTSAPTVVYSGNAGLTGARMGDDVAVTGSGASAILVTGYNSSPSVTGNSGYAVINLGTGTATAIGFTGTPPNAGDFRLGITLSDSSHVIGTAGSSLYRYSSFSGTTGTLISSPAIPDPSGATADRLLAYTSLAGRAILAIQSIGDSHVSIYDVSDPSSPVYLASGDNTTGTLTANGNATGELAWGDPVYNSANGTFSEVLYAMSSNQGIQAFVVTVPEPGTVSLLALGAGALGLGWSRRRAKN